MVNSQRNENSPEVQLNGHITSNTKVENHISWSVYDFVQLEVSMDDSIVHLTVKTDNTVKWYS